MMRLLTKWASAVVWALAPLIGMTANANDALATTYYVDATSGSDNGDGLSTATAWKTIAKVNGMSFLPGDAILFKRGETWRESLVVPSSGTAGSSIRLDAFGTGPAPTITGYLELPASAWSVDSGNVWKATVTASSMNFVLLGTIWGAKQTSKASIAGDRDWYFVGNTLYVFATSNPTGYYGSVAAMLMPGSQLLYINGKSYVDVQHFRLSYFDTYGVRIGGAISAREIVDEGKFRDGLSKIIDGTVQCLNASTWAKAQ